MGEAHRPISVHFLRPPDSLRQPLVVIHKHARQRIKQIGGKPRPVGFREFKRQGFDFCERDHTDDHCPDFTPDQAAFSRLDPFPKAPSQGNSQPHDTLKRRPGA